VKTYVHCLQPEGQPYIPLKWRDKYELEYSVGFDVGQSLDPSAVAIIERRRRWGVGGNRTKPVPKGDPEYHVRHLERFPLGESYTAQGQRLARMLVAPELARAELLVDATGCGRPVLELLQRDLPYARGVIITSSSGWERHGGLLYIGKLPLISALQSHVHDQSLKVAKDLPEAQVLSNELANFKVTQSATGSVMYSARSGAHDDLVLAIALALWAATRRQSSRFELVPTLGL
jgi:hypothetical protein